MRRESTLRRLLVTVLILGAVGLVTGYGTFSAFTATTTSGGNAFSAGTVALEDNDNGTAMLNISGAKPNDSQSSCIKIRYTGSLDSAVRLYASVSGSLAQYLTLTITRGTDATPSFGNCSTFVRDAPNYIGAGQGIIYNGNLSAFAASYDAGLVDPLASSAETWTTNEEHVYRFRIALQDENAAQGLSASASFTWEARNL